MFERFTDKGRKIIILAREEAERHQNDYLGTEHLVLAILRESDGIALMILKKMGLSTEQIRLEIERNLPGGGTTMTFGEIPSARESKRSSSTAWRKRASLATTILAASISCWDCCGKKRVSEGKSFAASEPTC